MAPKRVHKIADYSRWYFAGDCAISRGHLVVGVELTFTWYWLAGTLCAKEGIVFVLGHAP